MAPHMRSRVAVLHSSASGLERTIEVVPLHRLSGDHRTQVVDRALKTKDMNNEHVLRTVRERLDRFAHLPPTRIGPLNPSMHGSLR